MNNHGKYGGVHHPAVGGSFREKLFNEILPYVSKPARYTGNELNSTVKTDADKLLRVALCFPEMYEIGMSYLGMQIIYNLLNKRPDCAAERAFAVWPDMEQKMRQNGIPLFSLETSTPLREFDVLGFHLTYEMTYATTLAVLDLAGIPIRSSERSESDPVILAGGPAVMNPEPMADFIDAFFIGEVEESLDRIVDCFKDAKTGILKKRTVLEKLSTIPGIYVPRFYEPEYDEHGRFNGLKKLRPEAPDRIRYIAVKELKSDYYPSAPIVPYVETAQDHLSIEIMRGCVRGCRFCQAGYQYRPQRQREPNDISTQVFAALSETGYDEITLLSLSSTDYARLDDLLSILKPRLAERKISIGLPSLRPETVSVSLLNALGNVRGPSLTIAPEAGTERLRNIAGKNISDEEIVRAAEIAFECGCKSIKLYFMIGLPGESDDDIDGIIAILRKMSYLSRRASGKHDISVTLAPFNPKSHTPWQWEKQADQASLRRSIDRVITGIRKPEIKIRYPELDLAVLEGALGRGDRRMGSVIEKAFRLGARLDGWTEWFEPDRWMQAFSETGIDPSAYTGALDEASPLPWDHIDKGISKDYLQKENQNSKLGILPKTKFDGKKGILAEKAGSFGRRVRRASQASTGPPSTYKLRIRYGRDSGLRFLSHLDTIRAIYRAIRRSGVPVAFSEGFHPHLKVSFGPPLPVGHTSDAEYLDLQLTQPFREDFIDSLNRAFPPGLMIKGCKQYFAKTSSLTKQLNLARYEITLGGGFAVTQEAIDNLLSREDLMVTRTREDSSIEVEVRRFMEDLRTEGSYLIADISQTPEGHIKPDEILIYGLGMDSDLARKPIYHRREQFHRLGERLIDPLELV